MSTTPRTWAARIAAASLFVLVWLSSARAQAEQPLRLWHAYRGAEQQALEQILAGFDGEVELLAVPYDAFASKLESAIPLGEGPHLFIDAHERLGDFHERGIVAPVPFELADDVYTAKLVAAVTIDGQLLAVPISQKCLALYINTDLVGEPPTTLEQIAGLRGLPDGTFALAYEARGAYAHAAVLAAFGGALLDVETDDYAFEGPAAARSLELVASLIAAGVVPEDADGALVTKLFASGNAATAISGPWLAADLDPSLAYVVTPLPVIAATGQRMRPLLTVEAVMLSPRGAAEPDAVRLVEYLTGREAGRTRARLARSVPARADVELPDDPVLAAFVAQASLAEPTPSTAAMRAVWEPANRAIRKYLRGDADVDATLAEGRRRFDDVRRPPPPPANPAPLIVMLGLLSLAGAGVLIHRARTRGLAGESALTALRRSLPAYAYIAVGVVAVTVLVILPILFGAGASLFAGKSQQMYYVGLANFVQILTARGGALLSTGSFYVVLAVTVLWTIVNVAFHVGIGVTLALALSRPAMRLRGLYRVLLIVPWAVPSYVTALAWRGMFHRQFGAVTGLIHAINDVLGTSIEPIAWFARFSTAFAANVATNVWLGFPFMMVVTLGALAAVPKDVLEAAEVDGASRWQRLTRITLPMIGPTMLPAVTLGAIWTFNMFNVVFLVSGGDPDGTTDILVSEAYRWAFTREAQYGYAAAYAVLIFLLLLCTSRLADRLLGREART